MNSDCIQFSTDTLRLSDRLPYWREAVCANLIGAQCEGVRSEPFSGSLKIAGQGSHAIAHLRASAHTAWTSPSSRRVKDFCMLYYQRTGSMRVRNAGGDFRVDPGDIYFYDSVGDHRLCFEESFDHVVFKVPRVQVQNAWPDLAHLASFVSCGHDKPLHRMIGGLLQVFTASDTQLTAKEADAVSSHVFGLFTASLRERQATVPLPKGHGRRRLLGLARDICAERIGDPGFGARQLADLLGVSRRYLDTLFEDDEAPASSIQRLRLSRCRADLESAALQTLSLSEIAYNWGFKSPSHFSAAFRKAYGQSPSAFRRQATARWLGAGD
nr:helix-turn-helix domain-containing protein [uncultured Gellertiella sp.]